MSGITAINVAAPQIPPAIAVAEPSGGPTTQSTTAGGDAAQPAVVVSLSNGAAASVQASPKLASLDPNEVDDALSWAAGANGFAFIAAHTNEAHLITQFGTAIAEHMTAGLAGDAGLAASDALSYASNLGIPIQDSVSPDAVKNGAAPGTISVGAFSFESGGSTYSVTPGTNGTLIGTKDGQAWKTWQLTDPAIAASANTGADTALQTLTSLTAQETASANQPSTSIDISA
jgi:hypothetical protein